MLKPLIIRFIYHLLFPDRRVIDDYVQVSINIQRGLNYFFHIFQIFIVRHNACHIISLISNILYCQIKLFLPSCSHDDLCTFFCEELSHGKTHAITCA